MAKKKIKFHATVKSILGIVLLLVMFSLVVLTVGYATLTDALMEQYTDGAYLTAKTAAQLVNADSLGAYSQIGREWEASDESKSGEECAEILNNAEYVETWNNMDRLCNSSGATFIYVIIPTEDYSHIRFVFSTIDHNSKYSKYKFWFLRETTNEEYKQKYRALYEGTADRETVIRDKGYIETDAHITLIVPLKDSEGKVQGLLCVQRQMDVLTSFRNRFLNRIIISLVILIVVVIVVQSLFLNWTLLRPLKLISSEAIRFSNENSVPEKKLAESVRNRDEIGALAESIDVMEEQVHDYIENITKITAEKQRISTELDLATRIQTSMLPNTFPAFPERPEFDIFASMDPAREVGGDFYDFFMVDDDHLYMTIADVSGKGVPAALFMMASRILLANNAKMGKSPAEVLRLTNESICRNNREEMFVTVWAGVLEISTGKLIAANAGHEYPVLKQPDGQFEIVKDKHGFVIGGMSGAKYAEYELLLKPGAKLFLYTDGVPEATDENKELYGVDRLLDALNAKEATVAEEMLKNVRKAVDDFVKDAEQFDDLTMLGLIYKGGKE